MNIATIELMATLLAAIGMILIIVGAIWVLNKLFGRRN